VRSLREAVITCLEIAKDAPNPTAVASSSMDEQQLGRAL
jgi:hypothetical protein